MKTVRQTKLCELYRRQKEFNSAMDLINELIKEVWLELTHATRLACHVKAVLVSLLSTVYSISVRCDSDL